MASSQVAAETGGHQIWKVVANTLKKQSKDGTPSLGVGSGAGKIISLKKHVSYEALYRKNIMGRLE
jgi:hypothetical protein